MKSIFLAWHLGLGDAIICNGLVRELADRYDRVTVPAKHEKLLSVFWMLSDLVNVFVVPVNDDAEMLGLAKRENWLGLGLHSKRGLVDRQHWDRQFYEDAGVPFEYRWTRFATPPIKTGPKHETVEYAFVHQEPHYPMVAIRLPGMQIYVPPKPPHIFWNMEVLMYATEIHVVNSCFLSLAESITTHATRLVLHNYARTDTPPPTLHKNWEILN